MARCADSASASGPLFRPIVQRHEAVEQVLAFGREAVARFGFVRDDARLAQLLEPGVEDARTCLARRQQFAESEVPLLAQFPEHAQRPAPPEEIEQRHDRPAGRRTAYAPARFRYSARAHPRATKFIA